MLGCATTQAGAPAQADEALAMRARLEEVERTNGRLAVRVEELEDQLFLLNDRVEAHRLAMQRGGFMRANPVAYAPQAPQPAPETYYEGTRAQPPQRPVRRIQLGAQQQEADYAPPVSTQEEPAASAPREEEEEEVVISDDRLQELGLQPTRRPQVASAAAPSRGPDGSRQPQPEVTQERLKPGTPSAAPEPQRQPAAPVSAPVRAPQSSLSGLGAYREGLSHYRAGHYQEALSVFEGFLASKPQEDYIDNALYWIGECQYGLARYELAVQAFERVLAEQPDGNKVPDAMLKMSLALDRVGREQRATEVLSLLTQRYPLSNAGRLGAQKLKERQ